MRISDWSADVCSSDLSGRLLNVTTASASSSGAVFTAEVRSCQAVLGSSPSAVTRRTMKPLWVRCTAMDAAIETRSEEHTSELQSLMRISYAVFCLKKKNNTTKNNSSTTHIQTI